MGFGSKDVEVVTVWEVLAMAGSSLHLYLCRVRSKLQVVVVPHNSHSKIHFGVLNHKALYAKESNGSRKECYNVGLGASKKSW